jgi:uncharacterized membrane protein YfcA
MDITFYIVLFLIGIGTGLISGALGLGGGVLMVPAFMTFVPHMETHTAKGTSLFLIIFVSAINAWRQNRHLERVPWELAAWLALGSIFGGYASAWITSRLPEHVVLVVFLVLLVLMASRTFLLTSRHVDDAHVRTRRFTAIGIGVAAGIFGGATGTGGGSVLIPLALMAGIVVNERAVGLSNLVMVATAIAGTIAHLQAEAIYPSEWTIGHVYFGVVPLVFIGSQISSPYGEWLNTKLTLPRRKVLMGVLLLLIALRLAWRLWTLQSGAAA